MLLVVIASLPRRLLGLVACAILAAPWLAARSGAQCLGFCATCARDSLATSALGTLGGDPLVRAEAVRAVLDREAAIVLGLAALAATALVLLPKRRVTWAAMVAASVGAIAVESMIVAWCLPRHAFGVGNLNAMVLAGGVVSIPVLVCLASIAPAWRDRVAPALWPALGLAALGLALWPAEHVKWGARAAPVIFVIVLFLESRPPRVQRRRALAAILGALPLALLATARPVGSWALGASVRALAAFEGRDLKKLPGDESDRLNQILEALDLGSGRAAEKIPLPDGSYDDSRAQSLLGWGPRPWCVAQVRLDRRPVLVLVEGQPTPMIPGASAARITLLDFDSATLAREYFAAGWRIIVEDASVSSGTAHGFPLVDITSGNAINGEDVGHQLYGLSSEGVFLVRLESSTGEAVRNVYAYPNHTVRRTCAATLVPFFSGFTASALPWTTKASMPSFT